MTTEALAKQNAAVPAYIKQGDTRGTENIQDSDVKLPALKLAQGTTPQTKRSQPEYIEGLREGEFFDTATRENFGEGPVHFVVVNMLGHRHVEFDPADRSRVLDGNVPDDDPRTKFTTEMVDGKEVRRKPKATKFYDYLIMQVFDGDREPEAKTWSLKSTQLKKGKELNTLLRGRKLPSFAFLWKAEPIAETRGQNSWYGWKLTEAGYPTEAQYLAAEACYEKTKDANIRATDTDADPAEPAANADDIPF